MYFCAINYIVENMKFAKEEAQEALRAKLSPTVKNIDAWERTIAENVETLCSMLGEESEIELDDFINKALPIFNTTAGFMRKTNAELAKEKNEEIETFKKQLEELGETKKEQPKSELEAALEERLKKLEKSIAERQQAEVVAAKRNALYSYVKKNGVKDDEFLDTLLSKVSITEDTDIEAEGNSYVEMYNKLQSRVNPNITPDNPHGGQNDSLKKVVAEAAKIVKENVFQN